ncbi:MAG: ABC transporter substrate-binding protein [Actinomycetota bacterium]|jgi:peptide/nickel transport system substrate-binding protein|nr:ABC transporter substrate-binding protein [Actinomycetota bacterium]
MDRRTFLRAGLGAAGTLMVAGCTSSDEPDGQAGSTGRPTVRVAGGGLPSFPSPFTYFLAPGYNSMILIYDTLLCNDVAGQLLPWLAKEMPTRSDDGLTYTFELHENVRWHDGQPLTADDVVFTFEYFAGQTLSPTVSVQPRNVAEVRQTGPFSVEFVLDLPIVNFNQQVAGAVPIVPRHIWSQVPDAARAQELELLVGSGPYRLESFSPAEGSSLYVANDDFFLGQPYVERVEVVPVGSELDALLAGVVEVGQPDVQGAGAAALTPFRSDPSFEIIEGPAGTGFLSGLNWNVAAGGAVSDPRFRHACATAIDRNDMVARLLGGAGAPGNPGFFPPDHPYRVDVEQYPFDPVRAGQILDEAGYPMGGGGMRQGPDGQPLRIELLSPAAAPQTELIVSYLTDVGVGLDVQSIDTFQIITRLNSGDYQMAVHPGGGVAGAPDFMRQNYSSEAEVELFFGAHGYVNPEFDQLAREQLVTVDEAERKRMFARMQQIVAEDLPLLHLYYPTPVLVFRKGGFDAWGFPDPDTLYNPETGSSPKQAYVTGTTSGTEIRSTG